MGLLGNVRNALENTGPQTEVFTYRCAECGDQFTMPKSRMISVQCPDCGSMNVRSIGEE